MKLFGGNSYWRRWNRNDSLFGGKLDSSPKRSYKAATLYTLLGLVLFVTIVQIFSDEAEDLGKSIHELISSRGFSAESHFITTTDGYILQLVRIVNPHRSKFATNQTKPVLLFHGFQCTGSLWLVASNGSLDSRGYFEQTDEGTEVKDGHSAVGNSLGFVLANRGYDVWLANYRGNPYSSNHTNLTTDDDAFWHFSMDEMVSFDLPAMIGHIRAVTGSATVGYVGHSQGNFVMFSLLASKPQYSAVVKPFIALSPVVYQTDTRSIMTWVTPVRRAFRWLFPRQAFTNLFRVLLLPDLCTNSLLKHTVCYWTYYLVVGTERSELDFRRLPVYLDNLLLGSSTGNLMHFVQMFESGYPMHYDYGDAEENHRRYNRLTPPAYDMSRINSTHIALIYAHSDWFNMPADVQLLKNALNVPLLDDYLVPEQTWNHLDLLWAKEVGLLVNSRILHLLNKY